jgi:diacylglycerol kinase family enzyme
MQQTAVWRSTKIAVVWNPRAGLWNRQEALKRAIARQRRNGIDMTLVPLLHDQSWADQLHALLAQGYETFAIAGGDGTVNSIATLLLNTPRY